MNPSLVQRTSGPSYNGDTFVLRTCTYKKLWKYKHTNLNDPIYRHMDGQPDVQTYRADMF